MHRSPSRISDRESALAFLLGRIDYERKDQMPYRSRGFKLDRMRALLGRLGHPERHLPVVHVAGTKGKGSTAAMIAAALSAAGHRTGLFTSPHIERLEERFVINGQPCPSARLVELLRQIAPAVAAMDDATPAADGRSGPTFFEITTAAALLYLRQSEVDCAVLEVGLGGRLDSTNVCTPLVAVITSISFDHTRQLGNTLAAIATEKAGIIKPRVPVVIGVEQSEPCAAIRAVAARQNAPVIALGHDFDATYKSTLNHLTGSALEHEMPVTIVDYRSWFATPATECRDLQLRMLGAHQARNAAVALATLQQLQQLGWDISQDAMRTGLATAFCPARVEVTQRTPLVILDAAHNVASIRALLAVVNAACRDLPRILVFATSRDKNAHAMLAELLPEFEHVILTRYVTNPRAVPAAHLAEVATAIRQQQQLAGVTVHVVDEPTAAWQQAQQLATPAHTICITGSFFLAAELRPMLVNAKIGSTVFS